MKEHQHLQTRERGIRSMEHTLEDELQRVAEKERNLDARIVEITRLEARLHKALLQQGRQLQKEPQEIETINPNNAPDDREVILGLREKKLAFSLAQVNAKEKHLQAKERALNDKEAELASFQAELERKDRDADVRLKMMEGELRAGCIKHMTSVDAAKLELEYRRTNLEEREASLVCRDRAATAQAVALEQFQRLLLQQHECSLMIQEDFLARGVYLHERITATTLGKSAYEQLPQDNAQGRRRQLATPEVQMTVLGNHSSQDQPQRLKRKGTLGRFFK
ncbi:hypothetical protein PHYPSEUDO_007063 [Phytophthora pseudosyringae]|uniref:Uncharacterized protein n=1 Tax=Phytophthora pseudosyringae TaxID=221518 RepID=A0A8T1VKC5_9STRA|nr:hypothetical protein PHYPSEUDO_007063 [Phytophthora pseudosyringae]